MNKKVETKKKEVIYDGSEDLKIKSVAHFKNSQQILLLIILTTLFGFTLFCTLFYIGKYYDKKNNSQTGAETIQVNTMKNNVLITNNGEINKEIVESDIDETGEVKIEKISIIDITTDKNADNDGYLYFDIQYDITKNDFITNSIATTKSDVLVRFSYSFDNENWEYINNVISTTESTLNSLMGSYYDISGLVTNLHILTNYELLNEIGKTTKMYWKCETIIKTNNNVGKTLNANFKINYRNNV